MAFICDAYHQYFEAFNDSTIETLTKANESPKYQENVIMSIETPEIEANRNEKEVISLKIDQEPAHKKWFVRVLNSKIPIKANKDRDHIPSMWMSTATRSTTPLPRDQLGRRPQYRLQQHGFRLRLHPLCVCMAYNDYGDTVLVSKTGAFRGTATVTNSEASSKDTEEYRVDIYRQGANSLSIKGLSNTRDFNPEVTGHLRCNTTASSSSRRPWGPTREVPSSWALRTTFPSTGAVPPTWRWASLTESSTSSPALNQPTMSPAPYFLLFDDGQAYMREQVGLTRATRALRCRRYS